MIYEKSTSRVIGRIYSRVEGIHESSYNHVTNGYLGTGLTFDLSGGQDFSRQNYDYPLPEGVNLLPVTNGATKKYFELKTENPEILPISKALIFTSDTSKLSKVNEFGLFASIDPEGHGNAFRPLTSDASIVTAESVVFPNVVKTTNAFSNTYRIVAANRQCNDNKPEYFSGLKDTMYVCSGFAKKLLLATGCDSSNFFTIRWKVWSDSKADTLTFKKDTIDLKYVVLNDSIVNVKAVVIDPRGCIYSKTIKLRIIASANPAFNLSPALNEKDAACPGVPYTLSASVARTLNLNENVAYKWILGEETGYGSSESIQYKFPKGTTPVDFSVVSILSNDGKYECRDTVKRTIAALEVPALNVDFNKCEGMPAELKVNWSAFNTSKQWVDSLGWEIEHTPANSSGILDNLENTITEKVVFSDLLTSQIYNVKLTAVSNQRCAMDTSFIMAVSSVPTTDILGKSILQKGDVEEYLPSTVSDASLTYCWNGNALNTSNSYLYTATEVKKDKIQLQVKTLTGCAVDVEREILIIPKLNVDFNVIGKCSGDKYSFTDMTNAKEIIDAVNMLDNSKSVSVSYEWILGGKPFSTQNNAEKVILSSESKDVSLTVKVTVDKVVFVKTVTRTVTVSSPPSATISLADICDKNSDGVLNSVQATAILTSGTPNSINSSVWSFVYGENESYTGWKQASSHIYSSSGTYTVRLKLFDDNGCFSESTKDVVVKESPSISLESDYSTCGDTYKIPLVATNATNTWAFEWTEGLTGMNPTVTKTGPYSVTVKNNGCITKASTHVTLKSVAKIDFGMASPAVGCDVVELNIGAGWKTISWNDGNNQSIRPITISDDYSVEAVDQNGCPANNFIKVTINTSPKGKPKEFITICNDTQATLNSSLLSNYTYQWFRGKDLLGNISSLVAKSTGDYSVTVTDNNGCSTVEEFGLTVNPIPVFDLGANVSVCDAVTLTAPIEGDAYSWSTGATAKSIAVDASNKYALTITRNGCSFKDNVDVVVNKTPQITVTPLVEVCEGTEANVMVETDASQILWSNGRTDKMLTTKFPGKYDVIASNGNGCYTKGSTTVVVNALPVLALKDKYVICGGEYNLSAGGSAASYSWTGPDGFNSMFKEVNVNKEGVYSVVATDSKGCSSSASTNLVVIDQALTANFLAAGTLKKGEELQLLNFSYPTPHSQKWSVTNGFVSEEEDPTIKFYLAGEYLVKLKVWNDGCVDSLQKKIVVENVVYQIPSSGDGSDAGSSLAVREFNVYPNPVSDKLNVEVRLNKPVDIMLMISDMSGRVIMMETVSKSEVAMKVINMKPFAQGSYIVTFTAGQLLESKKIIKE